MTPFAAQAFFQHDVGHRVRNAFSSLPDVQHFLGFVKIGMTGLAIGNGFNILDDFVLDLHVALVTFNLVFGDMFCMHQIRVIIFIESLSFPVAFVTIFPGDFSISNDSIAMTFITGKSAIKN
jgi:hypothetical protein